VAAARENDRFVKLMMIVVLAQVSSKGFGAQQWRYPLGLLPEKTRE
jgi:hypothetical protein